MASFNFTIVPRCPRPDEFVAYLSLLTEGIKGMSPANIAAIGEFKAIICLYFFRFVAEVCNSSLSKVYRAVTALLNIRINESLT